MADREHGTGSKLRVTALTGKAIAPVIADVSRLRIDVFRAWPYLYDGTLDHERGYLAEFAACQDAVVVAAYDGGSIVGAATAAPLHGHSTEFVPLFAERGFDSNRIFYFGESVLLPTYRGHRLGHAFFDHREAHARACRGTMFTHAAFCSVVRTPDDPRLPPGYRPLDAFWMSRGYAPVDRLTGTYRWKEIDQGEETDHVMQFWMRAL